MDVTIKKLGKKKPTLKNLVYVKNPFGVLILISLVLQDEHSFPLVDAPMLRYIHSSYTL